MKYSLASDSLNRRSTRATILKHRSAILNNSGELIGYSVKPKRIMRNGAKYRSIKATFCHINVRESVGHNAVPSVSYISYMSTHKKHKCEVDHHVFLFYVPPPSACESSLRSKAFYHGFPFVRKIKPKECELCMDGFVHRT